MGGATGLGKMGHERTDFAPGACHAKHYPCGAVDVKMSARNVYGRTSAASESSAASWMQRQWGLYKTRTMAGARRDCARNIALTCDFQMAGRAFEKAMPPRGRGYILNR